MQLTELRFDAILFFFPSLLVCHRHLGVIPTHRYFIASFSLSILVAFCIYVRLYVCLASQSVVLPTGIVLLGTIFTELIELLKISPSDCGLYDYQA